MLLLLLLYLLFLFQSVEEVICKERKEQTKLDISSLACVLHYCVFSKDTQRLGFDISQGRNLWRATIEGNNGPIW